MRSLSIISVVGFMIFGPVLDALSQSGANVNQIGGEVGPPIIRTRGSASTAGGATKVPPP